MRNYLPLVRFCVLLVMAGVICTSCKTPPARPSKIPNRLILIVAGDVDSALVNRVQKFVEGNYGLDIWVAHTPQVWQGTLENQTKEMSKLRSRNEMGIVALAIEPPEISPHGIVDNQHKCAIINLSALKPATTTPDWQEKYARRVEKETIRAVGHLLGLPTCVDPHCAMSAYSNEQELDAKGRTLCPPCQHKANVLLGKPVE
jgi:hypothetical protein